MREEILEILKEIKKSMYIKKKKKVEKKPEVKEEAPAKGKGKKGKK